MLPGWLGPPHLAPPKSYLYLSASFTRKPLRPPTTAANMTSSRHSDPPPPSCSTQERYFHPLPSEPQTPQYIIVLPNYYRSHSYISRTCRRRLIYSAGLLFLAVAVFLLWPSDPGVSVARLKLRGFRVHPFPPSLDISLDLIVKVQNRDFYSVDYDALVVSIAYRRKRLGYVTSDEGHLKARASSYINATLELKGIEIITDVLPLIEDVARGSVTFDTVTEISGQLGLFLLDLPLQVILVFFFLLHLITTKKYETLFIILLISAFFQENFW